MAQSQVSGHIRAVMNGTGIDREQPFPQVKGAAHEMDSRQQRMHNGVQHVVAQSDILTRHEPYHDLGVTYFDERDRQAIERRLVRRLQALGYDVSLQPTVPAA